MKEMPINFDRRIVTCDADEDGGYLVALSCGHEVWLAVAPNTRDLPCAECVNAALERARGRSECQKRLKSKG
jgi:hypothetical protein